MIILAHYDVLFYVVLDTEFDQSFGRKEDTLRTGSHASKHCRDHQERQNT